MSSDIDENINLDTDSNYKMSNQDEFTVEKIIHKRVRRKKIEYFLKWKGYSEEHNSWEPIENLNCNYLIEKYEENLKHFEKINKNNKGTRITRKRSLPNSIVVNEVSSAGRLSKKRTLPI